MSKVESDLFVQIKSEKVAQNCWPFLAQFNWPLTGGS
jgi:hypothetical protein